MLHFINVNILLEKVPYIETWRAIDLANAIFGFNGWSSSVTNIGVDYVYFRSVL